jgi:hypothetical protein
MHNKRTKNIEFRRDAKLFRSMKENILTLLLRCASCMATMLFEKGSTNPAESRPEGREKSRMGIPNGKRFLEEKR